MSSLDTTLQISRLFLATLGTRLFMHCEDRIPRQGAVLVVSNHRSFLDPILLTAALGRPIRFACHHYMGQVPIMRDLVKTLGAFPLDKPGQGQQQFFQQAIALLQRQESVGVFPEGAEPMVKFTEPDRVGHFHRGFAHLALRAPIQDLLVLPVAIAAFEERSLGSQIPLRFLSLFDPSEPLFNQPGSHPLVFYKRVNVMIGRPYWITHTHRQQYEGKQAKAAVNDLNNYCQAEIANLLHQGCF
ncbi:lysophospholipid acyltransferase family protein [Merismopedia glauca]|uniref:1-acyl-sn-glycerol-3-phosphate acyltransferase n=1 Tax=Merismopedia glauca CCAP 1448/3 TaxID=1296344 RepID=A0A2T1BZM5_9CYAN|nr:lysophospholipid acyltransferase family protein [Merismopedia glauca]PSB01442.1 1-acyl-sn-glycerol-3-phosphate acyltransferase [Merismopedia glauca CCAP 1448/3]